jgi:hypothetical protein
LRKHIIGFIVAVESQTPTLCHRWSTLRLLWHITDAMW